MAGDELASIRTKSAPRVFRPESHAKISRQADRIERSGDLRQRVVSNPGLIKTQGAGDGAFAVARSRRYRFICAETNNDRRNSSGWHPRLRPCVFRSWWRQVSGDSESVFSCHRRHFCAQRQSRWHHRLFASKRSCRSRYLPVLARTSAALFLARSTCNNSYECTIFFGPSSNT